jgi:hypothetical protein
MDTRHLLSIIRVFAGIVIFDHIFQCIIKSPGNV